MYSAVSPKSGEAFSLFAPNVDTVCMNIFLEEMSQWLQDKKAYIVMDQAGWHKSKDLSVPDNIKIIHLPPYSPELNPVERLWQHIKESVLKNRIYESLGDLEASLSNFIKSILPSDIRSVCNVNYMSYYL